MSLFDVVVQEKSSKYLTALDGSLPFIIRFVKDPILIKQFHEKSVLKFRETGDSAPDIAETTINRVIASHVVNYGIEAMQRWGGAIPDLRKYYDT